MINRQLLYKTAMAAIFSCIFLMVASAQASKPDLPKEKQTTLGLYLTAKEAYEKWKADPDKIKILDVRTPEEYIFVGHPAMSCNITSELQTLEWDASKKSFAMKPNPDFLKQIMNVFQSGDIILVICRLGGRSARAVNKLAEAGYKNAYSITDGFEGDIVKDPESVFAGKRMVNGWKNSGLPWTYAIDQRLMLIPESK